MLAGMQAHLDVADALEREMTEEGGRIGIGQDRIAVLAIVTVDVIGHLIASQVAEMTIWDAVIKTAHLLVVGMMTDMDREVRMSIANETTLTKETVHMAAKMTLTGDQMPLTIVAEADLIGQVNEIVLISMAEEMGDLDKTGRGISMGAHKIHTNLQRKEIAMVDRQSHMEPLRRIMPASLKHHRTDMDVLAKEEESVTVFLPETDLRESVKLVRPSLKEVECMATMNMDKKQASMTNSILILPRLQPTCTVNKTTPPMVD